MAATLLPEYPLRTSRQKLSAAACPYLPRFGVEAHATSMNLAGLCNLPFPYLEEERACLDSVGPHGSFVKEEAAPMKAPSELGAEHLAKALVTVLLEQGLSPESLAKLGCSTQTKPASSTGLLPPGLALQLAVAGIPLDRTSVESEEAVLRPPPGLGLEDTVSVATSSTSELGKQLSASEEESDDNLTDSQQVPWQVSRQLQEHDPAHILEVRPVNSLGDNYVELLWEHFSQYFQVITLLVASAVGSASDTDDVAYVVADDATSVHRLLELGKEHIVAGHQVHLQDYGARGFEQLPEVAEEAIRDCGLEGLALTTDSETWEHSSSGSA